MTAMIFDIDAGLLRASADAASHARRQTQRHLEAEFTGDVARVMASLVPAGPYAYTSMGAIRPGAEGKQGLSAITARQAVEDYYTRIHAETRTSEFVAITEVNAEWYTFYEGVATVRFNALGQTLDTTTLLLFPCGAGAGVIGEMVWERSLGGPEGDVDGNAWRMELIRANDRFLAAMTAGDVGSILKEFTPEQESVVRDYVSDTGELVALAGIDGHRKWFESLLERYEIVAADVIRRISQLGYIFTETSFVARGRHGDQASRTIRFRTAEWFVPGPDGRIKARVGYGTDPLPD
jgi:hypothetical protein